VPPVADIGYVATGPRLDPHGGWFHFQEDQDSIGVGNHADEVLQAPEGPIEL
jgi:hypothetical protein